ncbi:hypothetical protein O6P43_014060 [Quillaja saponaria]|uniref:Secreted protein n=1 Tax=Quillaja saponaria TaxID=32244 RepID=A0AAD7LU06_QUISA|nr:hypothetical protein O6P43_014060 [Quillaja saponaria]
MVDRWENGWCTSLCCLSLVCSTGSVIHAMSDDHTTRTDRSTTIRNYFVDIKGVAERMESWRGRRFRRFPRTESEERQIEKHASIIRKLIILAKDEGDVNGKLDETHCGFVTFARNLLAVLSCCRCLLVLRRKLGGLASASLFLVAHPTQAPPKEGRRGKLQDHNNKYTSQQGFNVILLAFWSRDKSLSFFLILFEAG